MLYLFAGRERDTGLVKCLKRLASKRGVTITADEFDILKDPEHDLLHEALRQRILATLRSGGYDAVIMSPPCGTRSRAPCANDNGPRPLRSSMHPWGFPWLEGAKIDKVNKSNSMVELCLLAITISLELGTPFILEHAEDLGSTARWGDDIRPASIWQLLPIVNWVRLGQAFSGAFYQCEFGAPSPKPTRLLTDIQSLVQDIYSGMPEFSDRSRYRGHSWSLHMRADSSNFDSKDFPRGFLLLQLQLPTLQRWTDG